MKDSNHPLSRFYRWLEDAGLGELALFSLVALEPFRFVGAQLGYILSPMLGGDQAPVARLAAWLESPEGWSDLKEELNRKAGDQP